MHRATLLWLLLWALALPLAQGQTPVQPQASEVSVNTWLMRLHEASRRRTYTGTFVVTSAGTMGSAKIWHVCDGAQQIERVESLSGSARSIFRRNDRVVTFYRDAKVAVVEKRESLGLFPQLLQSSGADIGAFYHLQTQGSERVAGFDADVVQIVPNDRLRYGYRVWSEKKIGLVLQLQTLDLEGRVLEQVAFSNLELNAPVSSAALTQLMSKTEGYRVEHPEAQKTTAEAQGWRLLQPVAGFKPAGCFSRVVNANAASKAEGAERMGSLMHWIFSDGLATVSLFAEPFDTRRHLHEGLTDMGGAARTVTLRLNDWWITAVGEVPAATLSAFAQGLERRP